MKNLLILFLLPLSFYACAQNNLSLDQKLIGKWKAISKVEIVKTNGVVTDDDKELYKTAEKTYEFTKINTVIIVQGFGKHKEELPAVNQGNKLFIGKYTRNKTPYIVTYEQDKIKLLKTESKVKKGKSVLKTEEVVLQR